MPARPALILASTSRYRRELLERLRLPFEVRAPEVDETPLPDERPAALADRLALAKALAVSSTHPDAIVIGSDQVADLDGQAIGKPGSHERAVAQLRAMSGRARDSTTSGSRMRTRESASAWQRQPMLRPANARCPPKGSQAPPSPASGAVPSRSSTTPRYSEPTSTVVSASSSSW